MLILKGMSKSAIFQIKSHSILSVLSLVLSIVIVDSAAFAMDLEAIEKLSGKDQISHLQGLGAMKALPKVFPEPTRASLTKLQLKYNTIHNRLFVLTHLARITKQIEDLESQVDGSTGWRKYSILMTKKVKQGQQRRMRELLRGVNLSDYQPLNSLGDLGKSKFSNILGGSLLGGRSSDASAFMQREGKMAGGGLLQMGQAHIIRSADYYFIRSMIKDYKSKGLKLAGKFERKILEMSMSEAAGFLKKKFDELPPKIQFSKLSKVNSNGEAEEKSVELNKAARKFALEVGATSMFGTLKEKDLSALFSHPKSQMTSYACAGFAISSSLEFELRKWHQLDESSTVSPWVAYGTLRLDQLGKKSPGCLELENSAEKMNALEYPFNEGIFEIPKAVKALSKKKVCIIKEDSGSPAVVGSVSLRSSSVLYNRKGAVSFNLIKAMIDHEKPPVVFISSDKRHVIEDWMRVVSGGASGHLLMVVGYGESGINPFTLKTEPYFILRDSLAKKPIHYRVSAKNFIKFTGFLLSITSVTKQK